MWWTVRVIVAGLLGIGAVLMQISPDQAQSNLSKWLSLFTDSVPPVLQSDAANQVTFIALAGGALALLLGPWIYRSWRNRASNSPVLIQEVAVANSANKIDRVPLIGFLGSAVEAGWDLSGNDNLIVMDMADGLRQAAIDGEVTFWGRQSISDADRLTKNHPLTVIPSAHFETFQLDVAPLVSRTDNFKTATFQMGGTSYEAQRNRYVDLHLEAKPARSWLATTAEAWKGRRDGQNSKLQ